MNVIKKSQVASFVCTLLLGPIGLLYSSIVGGVILSAIAILTAGTIIGPILCWPISILAGVLSVRSHNKNVETTIALLGGRNQ